MTPPDIHMDLADLFGVCIVITLSIVFIRWHLAENNKFNLLDLICTEGRVNDKKFMRFGAFVVMTWGFYWLAYNQKMTEWYFAGYGVICFGQAALDKSQWLKGATSTQTQTVVVSSTEPVGDLHDSSP